MTEENKKVLLDYFSGRRIFRPTEKDDWDEAIKERDEKIKANLMKAKENKRGEEE